MGVKNEVQEDLVCVRDAVAGTVAAMISELAATMQAAVAYNAQIVEGMLEAVETLAEVTRVDVVLTLKEAADFLKMHKRTLQRLVAEGKVPAGRIGNEYRFSRDKLARLVEGEQVVME